MKTPNHRIVTLLLSVMGLGLFLSGCAVSPDYSNYDWHQRGGMVDEPDRSLAGARIEPFQGNRRVVRTDVSMTPPGATPAEQQALVVDPGASDIVAEGRPRITSSTRRSR
jgi:hypothetical protein